MKNKIFIVLFLIAFIISLKFQQNQINKEVELKTKELLKNYQQISEELEKSNEINEEIFLRNKKILKAAEKMIKEREDYQQEINNLLKEIK